MNEPKRPRSPEYVRITFGPDQEDSEPTTRTFFLPSGFPYLELREIGQMLEKERVFVPGYEPPLVGLCDPDAFIFESQLENVRTVLLPDRNIASRMAQIAGGVSMDDMLRKVAAIKAFCHFLDIQMEPSVAFHELAYTQGNAAANEELAKFRDADSADPDPWLDLAFGDKEFLTPLVPQHVPDSIDLAFPLRRWRRNYIVALKIAELELANGKNLDRILGLFSWMRDDFLIAGPAALLACIYFAPNSPPKKGLFKNLRSTDRQRALHGVRNAAWDLTHLSELVRQVNENGDGKIRLIFASFDEGLRDLAKLLFVSSADEFHTDRLEQFLGAWWPAKHASTIALAMEGLFGCVDDKVRKQRQASSSTSIIDEMIESGERKLLTWSSCRK